jgi:SAM-dependent methyltransferase
LSLVDIEEKMGKKNNEWIQASDIKRVMKYHQQQYETPYRSTVALFAWLEECNVIDKGQTSNVLDVCCGMGANSHHFTQKFANSRVTGLDINETLIGAGQERLAQLNSELVELKIDDFYSPDGNYSSKYEGLLFIQTLLAMPDLGVTLKALAKFESDWILLSSLFTETEVSATTVIKDYTAPLEGKPYRESFYNTYPVQHVKDELRKLGYPVFRYIPFEIDIDLPKPDHKGMTSFTETLLDGSRLQMSGPILMPWAFAWHRNSNLERKRS